MMDKYKTVLLTDFVEALEKVDDLCSIYIHKLTGELIQLTEEACEKYERIEITGWDNYVPWEMETIKEAERVLNDPEFIKIPDKFEIHEYRIMEDFIGTIQNDTLKDEFYHAIQGKGAFQRFKNKLYESGIETDWFDYKKGQLAHFSRDWLRKNKIHFIDDFRI